MLSAMKITMFIAGVSHLANSNEFPSSSTNGRMSAMVDKD